MYCCTFQFPFKDLQHHFEPGDYNTEKKTNLCSTIPVYDLRLELVILATEFDFIGEDNIAGRVERCGDILKLGGSVYNFE